MIFTEAYSGPHADSKVAQYTTFISFRIFENLLHVAGNIVTPRHYSYDKKRHMKTNSMQELIIWPTFQ